MKKLFIIAAAALMGLTASAQNLKFAHVDFQALIIVLPEYSEATEAFATAQKDAQENLNEMLGEYQKKAQAFEKNAATWSQTIRESKQKELASLQQRIEEFQQDIQGELQQMQQASMAPIQQKVDAAIKEVAKAGGYVYVFDRSQPIYIDESLSTDLTPAVRKALNIPDDRTPESVQAELQAKAAAAQAAQAE